MESDSTLSRQVKVYTILIVTVTVVVGVLGNILSILSVCFYTKESTKALYMILVNLFVTGLLLSSVYYPVLGFHVVKNWPHWTYGDGFCQWYSLTENASTFVVVLSVLLLSIDRFLVTVRKKGLSIKGMMAISGLIWVVSIASHAGYSFSSNPTILGALEGNNSKVQNITNKYSQTICVCNAFINTMVPSVTRYLRAAAIVNIFFLLLGSFLTLYTGVSIFRGAHSGPLNEKKYIQQQFKVTLIIIAFTWIFYLPKWMVSIALGQSVLVRPKLLILANVVGAVNLVLPPVICIMFLKDFRRAFIGILKGCKGAQVTCILDAAVRRNSNIGDAQNKPLAETELNETTIDGKTPPLFKKGRYKTCDNNMDESISIDSTALEQNLISEDIVGQKNEFYERSI